jgi:hypothetical protein
LGHFDLVAEQQYDPSTPAGLSSFLPKQTPLNSFSTGLEASRVASAGECRLFGFTVSSTRGSGQFIQIFDATILPADGAVPIISIDIATVTAKGVNFGPIGRWMFRGIVICNSTTQGTKTIGAADCLFDVQYL